MPLAIGIMIKLVYLRESARLRRKRSESALAEAVERAGRSTDASATEKIPIGNCAIRSA